MACEIGPVSGEDGTRWAGIGPLKGHASGGFTREEGRFQFSIGRPAARLSSIGRGLADRVSTGGKTLLEGDFCG